MNNEQTIFPGDKFKNTFGTFAIVLEYTNYKKILVKFEDAFGYERTFCGKDLRDGQFTNPYDKTMMSVGFVGYGKFKASQNSKKTLAYVKWSGMMLRCHSDKYPAYKYVEVDPDWYNFQVFAEWFYEQPNHDREGWELDKDLLSGVNKIYSPSTCCFLPSKINSHLTVRAIKSNLLTSLREVRYADGSIKYMSRYIDLDGKHKRSGKYSTQEEAFNYYACKKREMLSKLSDEYGDLLADHIKLALCNFNVLK